MVLERRRFRRIDVHIIPDELYPIGGAEILRKKGQIVNLSAGGLAIDTDDNFIVGDNVYLTFTLPNKVRINEIYAHIIRVSEKESLYEIGVRFININPDDREAIRQFTKNESLKENVVEEKVELKNIKPTKRKKREKGIYKTAFRKPRRNKEFLEAVQSGVSVNVLMERFGLSESGISMLKKRLMKRDLSFRVMEKKFKKFDLKKFRKLKGMTQEELAKSIGVRRETITRWEKGLFEPSSSYKWKLMKKLSVKKVKTNT